MCFSSLKTSWCTTWCIPHHERIIFERERERAKTDINTSLKCFTISQSSAVVWAFVSSQLPSDAKETYFSHQGCRRIIVAAGDPSFPRGTTLSLFDTIPKRSLANREKVGFCSRPGWEENGTIGMEHAVFWWSCFPEEARTFGGDCCRRNSPCDVHATCSADGSRKDARSGVDHTPDGDALVFHCCNHDDVFG